MKPNIGVIARRGSTWLLTLLITLKFASAICFAEAGPTPLLQPLSRETVSQRLLAAYPGIITRIENNTVTFAVGTTLPLDDGAGLKPIKPWMDHPDIEDMFNQPYPSGAASMVPNKDFDPGRARNEAFFVKVYGDCRKFSMDKNLVDVTWLPKKFGHKLKFSSRNGAAAQLQAVSNELDKLPARFNIDLYPTAGTYNCRKVAGNTSLSTHAYGIAIDLALKHAHYWRWETRKKGAAIAYLNRVPLDIVHIFEKHGFIWGGRWYHYDTMHFEYRPELANGAIGPSPVPTPVPAPEK